MNIEYASGQNDDGSERVISVYIRDDKWTAIGSENTVYCRIRQDKQDCYLEQYEVEKLLKIMRQIRRSE